MDGERETVPASVQLFVARLDAVASLPWQARGNWLRAHETLHMHFLIIVMTSFVVAKVSTNKLRHKLTVVYLSLKSGLRHHGIDAVQNFTSPLTQVFLPLVVDDNVPETTKPSTGPIGVSYGPASH
jgi:hypothetical protein